MYKISNYSYRQAKKLNVEIYPSNRKGKKIDVFKKGKKVASIGALGYNDYSSFKKKYGKAYADQKRKAYYNRHANNIKVKFSPGYYAAKILW
jgi:hypothetical protein